MCGSTPSGMRLSTDSRFPVTFLLMSARKDSTARTRGRLEPGIAVFVLVQDASIIERMIRLLIKLLVRLI